MKAPGIMVLQEGCRIFSWFQRLSTLSKDLIGCSLGLEAEVSIHMEHVEKPTRSGQEADGETKRACEQGTLEDLA